MIDSAENKQVPQPTSLRAVSVILNEYFYPAANGYQAICVVASNKEEAEKIYFDKRVPVQPEEKVEEEINNE